MVQNWYMYIGQKMSGCFQRPLQVFSPANDHSGFAHEASEQANKSYSLMNSFMIDIV